MIVDVMYRWEAAVAASCRKHRMTGGWVCTE